MRELVDALEADGVESREAPPSEEERPWPKPMPTLFAHAKIHSAVRLFDAGETRGDVIKRAELEPKDATRVRKMFTNDLLRLNAANKLVIDERVLRKSGVRIGLRYWDERQGRWLDPYSSLR